MRVFISFFILIFISVSLNAQRLAVNNISMATKVGDSIGMQVTSKAILSLNSGAQLFKISIDLTAIIPNRYTRDSLGIQNPNLSLLMEGNFPVNNIDFLTTSANNSNYSMQLTARLNDNVQTIPINFTMIILTNPPVITNSSVPIYGPRIGFEFVLQPSQFGLDQPPYNLNNLIIIRVSDALINRDN